MRTIVYICALVLSIAALGMTGNVNTRGNTVIVPNVEDVTVQVASHLLHNAGLYPDIPAAADLSSLVVRQHPRPGEMLAPGGKVVLFTKGTTSTVTSTVTRAPAVPTADETTRSIGQSRISAYGTGAVTPSQTISQRNQPAITTGGQSMRSIGQSRISASGTGTVTPSQPTTQRNQLATTTGGQSKILYQPPQPRVSPYFVQDTVPRFYPSWYPRKFLTPASSQSSSQALSQTASQPAVSSGYSQPMYYITAEEAASYMGRSSGSDTQTTHITTLPTSSLSSDQRYPKVGTEPEGVVGIQAVSPQRVGVFETSAFPAASVPYVLRLRQEDAVAALQKMGLAVEIFQIEDSQVRPGLVIRQSPTARTLVPAGTKVQLWTAK